MFKKAGRGGALTRPRILLGKIRRRKAKNAAIFLQEIRKTVFSAKEVL
ncbi:MAG: hypothetical protein IJY40_06060 [Oscillospiraceae bacterium]|nr:hypothetical protein [Oscillospiraceae bacterium]